MGKKLIVVFLFIFSCANAQIETNDLFEFFGDNSFSQYAQQYFARYDVKPSNVILKKYAKFIDRRVADGSWTKLDECWIFANNTQANALLGVKGYKNCTAVNSPSFTAYRGFVSNGTTSYINTNYNPAANGVQLTTNSISFGAYSRTDVVSVNPIMGVLGTPPNRFMYIYPRYTGNLFFYTPSSTSDVSVSVTNSLGLFSGNRSGASSVEGYKNGTQVHTGTIASSTLINLNIFICCLSDNGNPSQFSTRQIAFAYVGGSLTQQQHLNLYNDIQELLTEIGAAV